MKKSIKKTGNEEEVAEKATNLDLNELNELQKFIQKQHIQNKILQKLIDDLQSADPLDTKKQKSA